VDKIAVGGLQRREIKAPQGFAEGAFAYNEVPTSSCHTFCWKARHLFDVPFFCSPARRFRSLKSAQPGLQRAASETFLSSNVERDASPP
jgi:hypothetical protein